MPLTYDDEPGSWGRHSEGWPETPYTMGKWLLCTKAAIVPYGSFVVMQPNYGKDRSDSDSWTERERKDHIGAIIRVETQAMLDNLEDVYKGMFIGCGHLLREFEPAINTKLKEMA